MATRPFRTSRLPELVGIAGACDILGVDKATLYRWLEPGTGELGPEGTYMVAPRRVRTPQADGSWRDGWPVWAREDVYRFAEETGRQRAAAGDRQAGAS